jgi:hypothetical protein
MATYVTTLKLTPQGVTMPTVAFRGRGVPVVMR